MRICTFLSHSLFISVHVANPSLTAVSSLPATSLTPSHSAFATPLPFLSFHLSVFLLFLLPSKWSFYMFKFLCLFYFSIIKFKSLPLHRLPSCFFPFHLLYPCSNPPMLPFSVIPFLPYTHPLSFPSFPPFSFLLFPPCPSFPIYPPSLLFPICLSLLVT